MYFGLDVRALELTLVFAVNDEYSVIRYALTIRDI